MAAACGDDDGGGDGGGGSGGTGGQGGSGGSGGSAGNGGGGQAGANQVGGAAGQTNVAGSSGVAGSGTAGSGTAGSGQAGAGTVPPIVDAGPDGSVEADASTEPDSGPIVVADSGVNGNCVGFLSPSTPISAQAGQDAVIARVIFNDDDETATVVLRVINAGVFAFGGDQVLCFGALNSECVAVDDGVVGNLAAGVELSVVVGLGVPVVGGTGTSLVAVDDDEGELFFAAEVPQNDPQTTYAYVNWGDLDSADVDTVGPLPTLEGFAVTANRWTLDDSLSLGGNNAFFGQGETDVETGFGFCTADQF